ncbi:hypothetical protein MRY82_02570 [bacterium]|nr:hypothetical protein [bacterium]
MLNVKTLVVLIAGVCGFFSAHAQDYCEPPVRGVYESGPEVDGIFSFQGKGQALVSVQDDFLLDPGRQAGKFFLHMTLEDVKTELPLGAGKNKLNPINQQNNLYYESYAQGLGFYFDQKKLVLIEVNNEDYKTREGIAIGSSKQKLEGIKDCLIRQTQYQCSGINFVLLDEGVKTIHIFAKND